MSCVGKEPIYDVYCIDQRYINVAAVALFGDVSMAPLVESINIYISRKLHHFNSTSFTTT